MAYVTERDLAEVVELDGGSISKFPPGPCKATALRVFPVKGDWKYFYGPDTSPPESHYKWVSEMTGMPIGDVKDLSQEIAQDREAEYWKDQ